MITMSVTKLLVLVVISGLIVVCSCNGVQETGPGTDEMPVYKNHRTSKNDTVQVSHKYPAQVYANLYANLSNAMDFTTPAKIVTELLQQSKTTEVPTDIVRMFITPSGGSSVKRRPAVDRTTPAVQVQSAVATTSTFKVAAAPSVYFVTARSVQENSTPPPAQKTPVYSPPGGGSISTAVKETTDFRVMAPSPTVTVVEPKRKLKLNGTKIRRLLKVQQRLQQAGQPTVLLAATSTTTTTTMSPPKLQQHHQQVIIGTNIVAQPRNTTAAATYAVATKVANSSGASKPFATVLVPKQILEGSNNLAQQDYVPRDDYTSSFRPIAAPVYAPYKPAVDTNAIVVENRRTSSASKTQVSSGKGQVSSSKGQVSSSKGQVGASKGQVGASKGQVGASKVQVSASKTQVSANKVQVGSSKAQVTVGSFVQTAPKLTKYGFVSLQQPTYKVEEYVPGDVHPSAVQYDKRFNGDGSYKKDRSEQLIFASAERSQEPADKPKFDQFLVPAERRVQELVDHVKYDPSNGQEIITSKPDLKYGFAVPESFNYERQQPLKSGPSANVQLQQQFREYYPATEVTPTAKDEVASYLKYNSAGKFDMRAGSDEMSAGPPYETDDMPQSGPPYEMDDRPPSGPPKEFVSGPSATRFTSGTAGEESSAPEIMLGNVNPKDVLKSLLADMLKTKQQSEATKSSSKPSSVDETIDSYFKNIKSSTDNSADYFDIETDMSCSLRSTKYITDGQCVTTKPIVEAVCADRCLVYASSQKLPFSPQRQRSAPSANQQVEALHCVNGDVKLMRVQLHCRDGNTLNNVIKVVTNCRCKLHQIQPQVRSNHQSTPQGMGMPNPDIMSIAKGSF